MLKELLPDYIYSNVKEFEKDYNFINENVLSKVKEKISNLYQLKKDKTTLLKIEKIIIYIVIKKLLIKSQNSKQNIDKVITDAIRQEKLDEPARTMLTSEGTVNRSSHIIYDTEINEYRILTPIECELIQMFPINWTNTMTEKRRYFMMGNALVTGIISRLESRLRKIIENE